MKPQLVLVITILSIAFLQLISASLQLDIFRRADCQDTQTFQVPSCSVLEQKNIFVALSCALTIIAVALHFYWDTAMLINAIVGLVQIVSILAYFFGIFANDNYKELAKFEIYDLIR